MINIRKLESELWESADLLRAGSKLTSNQYCMPVLGLIFLRYAYSRFKLVETEILKNRPSRGGRVLPIEASDFAAKSALYLPKEAQYEYLLNLPEDISVAGLKDKDDNDMKSLGEVVNNAMSLIEEQSEQLTGVLPNSYTDFSDEILSELLRIFNNSALDEVGGDVIGRIYEYFLNKFAKNIASDDGVFFTPKSLVKMIVNIIEPERGILLDPACGSGGMFIQSGDFVNAMGMNANSAMTFYGQEKVEYNAKLCLMNMAVHGLTGVIKSGDEANSFYHDAHNLNGCCDYVMANPPFNVDKVKSETCENAGRLPFGMPGINKSKEVGNANYLWISYFYSYLNEKGRAGFVMASSATDSQGKDKNIRERLVRTGHVDAMISVGNNFFYTKSLPCSLWFFDKGKADTIKDKVLFIDARNYYTVVDRTLNEWSDWQLKNMNAIVWLYRGEPEKYTALLDEYRRYLMYLAAELKADEICRIITPTTAFSDILSAFKEFETGQKQQAKFDMEHVARQDKKKQQAFWDERLADISAGITVAKEAVWLYEKFGDGVYADVLGLCKVATISEIEEKGWSLTPGAYSMVFFAKKVRRKMEGTPTFVILTDRDELNTQISDTFENCGLLGKNIKASKFMAASGDDLVKKLQGNPSFIFTLIQKFNQPDEEPIYPEHDIIIMSDEAHRSQYGIYADNMMKLLPTAARIGFTGTPLLSSDNITARTFGGYVSVYDFKRAVEDGATVPLYYENRGEKIEDLHNPEITEQILDAIEAADLDVDQQDKLEEEFAKEIHLVKTKFFYEKDAGLQEEHAEQAIAILNSCETEIANGN